MKLFRRENIEHPTSNTEGRTYPDRSPEDFEVGCSMFDVRCSRFMEGLGRVLPFHCFQVTFVLAAAFLIVFRAAAADREQIILTNKTGRLTRGVGEVKYLPGGREEIPARYPSELDFGDAVRTLRNARATVEFRNHSFFNMPDRSRLLILQSARQTNDVVLRLLEGQGYFLHRGAARSIPIETPHLAAVPTGTEFLVSVDLQAGQTLIAMFDGVVELTQGNQTNRVRSGEFGVAAPGQPLRVGRLAATNIVQWWIYYPGVIDLGDLQFSDAARAKLEPSLAAYRTGDLRAALERHPEFANPTVSANVTERTYYAALLLASGSVQDALKELEQLPRDAQPANALRMVIAAVSTPLSNPTDRKKAVAPAEIEKGPAPNTASELLALSYQQQSEHDLAGALRSARRAVERSPDFGFGWARVAELEFSHGNIRPARQAVEKALRISPHNAQAQAVRGFLLAGENRISDALAAFDETIRLDSALANGWLGRGFCRIRRGDLEGGREDLHIAAAQEPRHALVRSYAGKAFADSGEIEIAQKELAYAQKLDPNDPTPWLYSALLDEQLNRVNDAVRGIERSVELNDNRRVYRSQLLLDQDRAVRSANLANIYSDAGLREISLQEATRGVNADYANAAAHLFLANSYNALRDPRQVNLRYETPWLSEYLVANLLAPVGAGQLSQTVSQNEYGKLFERDRFGFANETTWTSNGDWLQQSAQFGQFGNTAYALDAYYRSEVGQRPNADLEQIALSATFKQQLTFSDSLFVQATWYNAESGDVAQRYDWSAGQLGFRAKERHEPLAALGWHHEWRPGAHTLLLVSPWHSTLTLQAPQATARYFARDEAEQIDTFDSATLAPWADYQSRFTAVSTELQQIVQAGAHTVIAGARYQIGEFDAKAAVDVSSLLGVEVGSGNIHNSSSEPALERLSFYAYDQWQIAKPLLLTFGLSYDYLRQPLNFRSAPVSNGERTDDHISPKIGLTINPWRGATLRGAYARSLTGASFDQSFRLEPAQVAGFNQAYRGLIPEALTAAIGGQELDTSGVGFEQRLATGTYFTIQAELLRSESSRDVGAFELVFQDGDASDLAGSTLRQDLDFTERALSASIGQLVGRDLALSARYRLAKAELNTAYPEVPALFPDQAGHQVSVLHQLELAARYHHPSGFFGRWESVWARQSNHGDIAFLTGDNFWQHNVWLGWRFHRRDAELAVGLLNLTGQDYQLHPLNYYPETYRDRTFAVSARFNF